MVEVTTRRTGYKSDDFILAAPQNFGASREVKHATVR